MKALPSKCEAKRAAVDVPSGAGKSRKCSEKRPPTVDPRPPVSASNDTPLFTRKGKLGILGVQTLYT